MAHMRFTYKKSNEHPFLSVLSYIFGILYALSAMMTLFSLISGQNIITGNRWFDALLFAVGTLIFSLIQISINNSMEESVSNIHEDSEGTIEENIEENIEDSIKTDIITYEEKGNENENDNNKRKKTYCKFCGSEIDTETKKCTGCGKQYGIKKILPKSLKPIIYVLLIISLVGNIALAGISYNYNQKYQKKLDDWYNSQESASTLRSLLASANKMLDSKEERINDLLIENVSMAGECNFFDEHACIVTPEGRKYHKYNCYHWKNSDSFWIYNIEAAEYKGYSACLDCY